MTPRIEYCRDSPPLNATDFTIQARDVMPLHASCLAPAGITVADAPQLTWMP
jgi:hypothetical protein